jgi:hypothetical protein
MKALTLLLGAVLIVALCAGAVPAEDDGVPVLRVQRLMCPSQHEVLVVLGVVESGLYATYLNVETGRMIVISYDGAGAPERFWFGALARNTGKAMEFGSGDSLTVAQARAKYPSPCDYLAPQEG